MLFRSRIARGSELKCRFSIGACDGDVLGHGLLKFLFQVGQQVGVGLSVDFLAENLLGAGDSELGDLIAQGFLGALSSDAGFGFSGFTGLGNDTGGFGARFIEEVRETRLTVPDRMELPTARKGGTRKG